MFETCIQIRNRFSDYLDDRCAPEARKSIRYHLGYCGACADELEQWQSIREDLKALPRQTVPSDAALNLRVQMSQRLNRHPLSEWRLRLDNALKPFLLPATGGVLMAVICFCMIMGSETAPATSGPDVTLQLVQPARVEQLAPMDFSTDDNGLLLVTQINAEGRVKGYRVVSGAGSPEMMHHLDRMIYFSIFQPATMFGKPTDGQVVLSLRRITVRG